MSTNSLLFWMSARREGTRQQFRAAVEQLHLPESELSGSVEDTDDGETAYGLRLHQKLWLNLRSLGHAEFLSGAGGSDWRVAPPCLAISRHPTGWFGVLAGARSPRLLARLTAAAGANLQTMESDGCPDIICLNANSPGVLDTIAHKAGITVQPNAPAMILMIVPAIDHRGPGKQTELPLGNEWKIEQFFVADLRWRPVDRRDAENAQWGLFQFMLPHRQHTFLCAKGTVYEIDRRVGMYLALRRARRKVLRYDRGGSRVSVPARCRPPFLVERALILCSGFPPSFEAAARGRSVLHYRNIPNEIAGLASALLRQG